MKISGGWNLLAFRILTLAMITIAVCLAYAPASADDSFSQAVSVKFPDYYDGSFISNAVSVKFPDYYDGSFISNAVSVKFPDYYDGIFTGKLISVVYGPPVATWPMDGDWLDSSDNDLDATAAVPDMSFEEAGRVGQAGRFRGDGDYLDVGTTPLLQHPLRFSIESWIRVAVGSSGEMLIAGNFDSNSNTGYGIFVDGNIIKAKIGDGTIYTLSASAPIEQGVWVYAVATYDGETLKLYINDHTPDEGEVEMILSHTASFTIGYGNGSGYFVGELDEISVYPRALTEEEIKNHFAVGAGIDIIPPEPPYVNPVEHIVATADIDLSGTKEVESLVLINWQPITPLTNATDWFVVYTLSPGINTLNVTSKDASGNESSPVVVVEVIYDNTAPYIINTTPFDGAFVNSFDSVDILLADEYSAIDFANTVPSASVMASDGSEVAGSWQDVEGHIIFTKPDLSDDSYTVSLVPKDGLGNSETVSFEFTVDSKAPEMKSLTISPDSFFKADETGTFTIVFNEEVLTAEPLTVTFGIDPPYDTYQLPGSWTDQLTWTGTYRFTDATGDGNYKLAVSGAADKAQNAMIAVEAGSFILDTDVPETPGLDPIESPQFVKTITISGTKESATAIYINDIEVVPVDEFDTWSVSYDLRPGDNTLAVTARDASDNISPPANAEVTYLSPPVALWHMDDDGWIDSVGDNDGTPHNGATFSGDAKRGTHSGSFDVVDDYVDGPGSGLPLGSSPRTVIAWIKTTAASDTHAIFHYGIASGSSPPKNLHMWVGNGKAAIGNGYGYGAVGGTSIVADGVWHLVAGVYEGPDTNIARIYVDGVEENSGTIVTPGTADGSFTIGRFLSGSGKFSGLIDELAVYDRALSADEIKERFDAAITNKPTVDEVPSETTFPTVVLSGTKPVGTSIVVNGIEIVQPDESTNWSGIYELKPGLNELGVTYMDAGGYRSLPVEVAITYMNPPVALWRMDGDWTDSSGNGNDGTPHNGATFNVDAMVGTYSGTFDGVNDYVDGPGSGLPLGSSPRTVIAWIKTTAGVAIFHYGTVSGSLPPKNLHMWLSNGKAAIGNGYGYGAVSGTSIVADGVWHLVAGIYEGPDTNIARIYVDGIEEGSATIVTPGTADGSFTIGSLLNGGSKFLGLIDELAVYNRALSADEIKERFDAAIANKPTVNEVPPETTSPTVVLSGTKPAGTSIAVNGVEIVPRDDMTTWSVEYDLGPGLNELYVASMDAWGYRSLPVNVNITYLSPPVAIWHMDGDWTDSSGGGHHGDPHNGVGFNGDAKRGTHSGSFDGADDYVTVPHSDELQSSEITVEYWIKGTTQASRYYLVVDKSHGFTDRTGWAMQGDGATLYWFFGNGYNWNDTIGTTMNVLDGFWHHVAGTFDGSQIRLYVDGNLDASKTASGTIAFNSRNVNIGAAWGGGSFQRFFRGQLDEVVIYDRALSAEEILEHYQTTQINPPTVYPNPSVTGSEVFTLSGEKEAGTSIYVNETELVGINNSSTWDGTYNLQSGANLLSIVAKDAEGRQSFPVMVEVVYDNTAPEITSSDPADNTKVFPPELITLGLADTYSALDLAATIINASLKDSSGNTIPGVWDHDGNSTVTFTPTSTLAEGLYTATVNPTDEFGNNREDSISFMVDVSTPSVTTLDMNPSSPHRAEEVIFIVNFDEEMDTAVHPTLTFSRDDNSTVFSIDSGIWDSNSMTWRGSFIFDAATGDGEYSVSISGAKDIAGNEMVPAPSVGNFVLDTVPPAEPVIYDVESPTRNSQVIISGQKDSESFCYVSDVQADAAYTDTLWDFNLSLHNGLNTISVYCRDEASNQSQTETAEITLDTQAPTLVSSEPADGTSVTELVSISIVLGDSSGIDPATISGAEVKMNGNAVDGEWSIDGGNVTFNRPESSPFDEGNYVVTLNPVDFLGNRQPVTFSFNVDRGPPSVVSLGMTPTSPHRAENVKFTITFDENMSGVQQVYFSKGSQNFSITGNLINPLTWQGWYDFRDTDATDGIYDVNVSGATDVAGNEMSALNIGTFELDTTAPDSPTIDDVILRTNIANQLIEGTKPENTAIVINGYLRVSINESTSWNYQYSLAEGTNNLSVVARDAAGNDSAVPATAQIVLDTTPPMFTVEYESITSSPSQTVSGIKEQGSIIKLRIGNEILDIGSDEASDTWEYTIENLIEGLPNVFTFIVSDDLGNTRTKSIEILYDISAPERLLSNVLVADGSGSGTEVTLSWDAYTEVQDVGYYRIYMSSLDFGDITGMTPIGTVDKGVKTYNVDGLTEGSTYYFAVVPVDMGGNYKSDGINTALGIPEDTEAPENVKINSVTAGHNSTDGNWMTIEWNPSANLARDLADQIAYFDDGSGYTGQSIGETATQYTKTGLSDDTVYKFKVTTMDDNGHESNGTVATGVTRLPNPSGLSAEPGNGKVDLSWQPTISINSQYLKHYKIYRRTSTDTQTNVDDMTFVTSTTSTSYTNTGLENEVTYQYAVTAVNVFGAENTEVQSVSARTRSDATGPEITAFSINEGDVITEPVTITASASDESTGESNMDRMELYVDGMLVETDQGGTFSYFWNIIEIEDGNYTIKVIAYDVHGNATELVRQVIVSLAPPETPQITNGNVVGYLADVAGNAPAGTTVTLKVNGLVVSSTQEVGGHFSFNSVELVEGDNVLAVKASHRGGDSPYSAGYGLAVDTGAPPAPVNLSGEARAGGSVLFTWEKGVGETPTGYNIYMSTSEFASTTGLTSMNSTPITYAFKDLTPPDDGLRYYAVTALDSSENESDISNLVSVASDRAAPSVTTIEYTYTSSEGVVTSPSEVAGLGTVDISMTVSEPLKELPFLSLEPESGSPIIISLNQVSETVYEGSFAVTAQSPSSPLTYKFSGKDLVGNRGTVSGEGITLDVSGPVAEIQEPLEVQQIVSGIVEVNVLFDEPPVRTPQMELRASDDTSVPIEGLTSVDGLNWIGYVDVSAMPEGSAEFVLVSAEDGLGNIGATVAGGRYIILYTDTVPPPDVPGGLAATTAKGGVIRLTWNPVSDITSYSLWRRAEGTTEVVKVLPGLQAPGAEDLPPEDGTYHYSVSSVGLLESESDRSEEVSAVSDRTGPLAPENLSVELTGSGVVAEWSPVDDESLFGYHLYRLTTPQDTIVGKTPIAKVGGTLAIDPAPTKLARFYVVVAVDDLKNEGEPSSVVEAHFDVPPVANLLLEKIDSGAPTISWTAPSINVRGYHIYRNGVKITGDNPVGVKTYMDGYYAGGTSTYGVSVVDDDLGFAGPQRVVTLSPVSAAVEEGTVLRRGLLETLKLNITSGYAEALNIDSISLKVGTATPSTITGPFTVELGQTLQVEKVAATTAGATGTVPVIATLQWSPEPGTTVKITRTSQAEVIGASTALEIFNEPLVRDTQGSVRLKFNNLGSALMEVVTSENNGKTTKVRINLRDQDGNLLSTGYLNQRTGEAIFTLGNYSVARLEPGASFITDPIRINIPANAPNRVVIEAVIQNTYYHYGKPDQVTAPGMKQTVETSIIETAYYAVAAPEKTFYAEAQPVVINGMALDTLTGEPVPNVPVRLGVSVKGFDRLYTVTTGADGSFTHTFEPGASEAGLYSIWAVHPDVFDRTVQATFAIAGFRVSPSFAGITIAKGRTQDVPVTLSNYGGAALTGLSFTTDSSEGITAEVINPGDDVVKPGENQRVTFRVGATESAPETGYAVMNATVAEGLSVKVNSSIKTVSYIPIIRTSPSYIVAGMVRGDRKLVSFTVRNSGQGTLKNASLEGPSTPWMNLMVENVIGDLAPGESRNIGIMLAPPDDLAAGTYNDSITIYSDNHIPYTYQIQVKVQSDAVGSVFFDVQNELSEKLQGAEIVFQHQEFLDLRYTVTTDEYGSALVNDIPEGRYVYNISATGHVPYSGTFIVQPGLTTTVPIALEVTLIDIEWSVSEVVIQDRYDITIKQTFQTEVPAPVVVIEPPKVNLPPMEPGQVFQGEFTVKNYGLIEVYGVALNFPRTVGDYDIEVMSDAVPDKLGAMQMITVPYRVTRRTQTASASTTLFDEVRGYGGSDSPCPGTFWISILYKYIVCPNSAFAREAQKSGSFLVSFLDYTRSCTGVIGSYPGSGIGTGSIWYYGGGGIQTAGIRAVVSFLTKLITDNPCNCKEEGAELEDGRTCEAGIPVEKEPQEGDPCVEGDPDVDSDAADCEKLVCSQQEDETYQYVALADGDDDPGECKSCGDTPTGEDGSFVVNETGTLPGNGNECDECRDGAVFPVRNDYMLYDPTPYDCNKNYCDENGVMDTQTLGGEGVSPELGRENLTDCVKLSCTDGQLTMTAAANETPANECEVCRADAEPVTGTAEVPINGDNLVDFKTKKEDGTVISEDNCTICLDGNRANNPGLPSPTDKPCTVCEGREQVDYTGYLEDERDNPNDCKKLYCDNGDLVESKTKKGYYDTPVDKDPNDCKQPICNTQVNADPGDIIMVNNNDETPDPENPCLICLDGKSEPKVASIIADDPFDCLDRYCDGLGGIVNSPDKGEVPDPSNPCLVCDDAGEKVNNPEPPDDPFDCIDMTCENKEPVIIRPGKDEDAVCEDCDKDNGKVLDLTAKVNDKDADTVITGLSVQFTSEAVAEQCGQVYLWEFGDDSQSEEKNPVHVFKNPDTYNVTVTVSCPCNDSKMTKTLTVEAVDLKVILMENGTEVTTKITDNGEEYQVVYIANNPKMPSLSAKLEPGNLEGKVRWQLRVYYGRINRNDEDYFPAASVELDADQTFTIDFGDKFRGGTAVITWQFLEKTEQKQYTFLIRGHNPTQTAVQAEASQPISVAGVTFTPPWYISRLIEHETGGKQFNEVGTLGIDWSDSKYCPNWGYPYGWGIMQIDDGVKDSNSPNNGFPQKDAQFLWNWKTNIAAAKKILKDAVDWADNRWQDSMTLYDAWKKNYNNDTDKWPCNTTYNGITFSYDGVGSTYHYKDAIAIKKYNGSNDSGTYGPFVQFMGTDASAGWEFHYKGSNGVYYVCEVMGWDKTTCSGKHTESGLQEIHPNYDTCYE